MLDRKEVFSKVCSAVELICPKSIKLEETHSFVDDLDFDSLRMATLSVALEDEIGQVLLLNDWISEADDPAHLSIGSLTDYVMKVLKKEN